MYGGQPAPHRFSTRAGSPPAASSPPAHGSTAPTRRLHTRSPQNAPCPAGSARPLPTRAVEPGEAPTRADGRASTPSRARASGPLASYYAAVTDALSRARGALVRNAAVAFSPREESAGNSASRGASPFSSHCGGSGTRRPRSTSGTSTSSRTGRGSPPARPASPRRVACRARARKRRPGLRARRWARRVLHRTTSSTTMRESQSSISGEKSGARREDRSGRRRQAVQRRISIAMAGARR